MNAHLELAKNYKFNTLECVPLPKKFENFTAEMSEESIYFFT